MLPIDDTSPSNASTIDGRLVTAVFTMSVIAGVYGAREATIFVIASEIMPTTLVKFAATTVTIGSVAETIFAIPALTLGKAFEIAVTMLDIAVENASITPGIFAVMPLSIFVTMLPPVDRISGSFPVIPEIKLDIAVAALVISCGALLMIPAPSFRMISAADVRMDGS